MSRHLDVGSGPVIAPLNRRRQIRFRLPNRRCAPDIEPRIVPGRHLRQLIRYRRTLVAERSGARNRIHKTLGHDGLRLGGVSPDIFGINGQRVLDGLAIGQPPTQHPDQPEPPRAAQAGAAGQIEAAGILAEDMGARIQRRGDRRGASMRPRVFSAED